jgi:hypothetical protein
MAHMFPQEHETELGIRVLDDILAVICPHLLRRYSMQIKYGENTSHRVMKLIQQSTGLSAAVQRSRLYRMFPAAEHMEDDAKAQLHASAECRLCTL